LGSASSPARARWGALALACVPLGLATRPLKRQYEALGSALGDALWALLVFALVGVAFPRWSLAWRAALALGIAVLVEVSQLWHTPWLEALRHNTLGALAIGGSFSFGDLGCYAAGIAGGCLLDRWLKHRV
jgi:Protein of unknown function (DUF2809)